MRSPAAAAISLKARPRCQTWIDRDHRCIIEQIDVLPQLALRVDHHDSCASSLRAAAMAPN